MTRQTGRHFPSPIKFRGVNNRGDREENSDKKSDFFKISHLINSIFIMLGEIFSG